MAQTLDLRAYINPQPALSETEQKELLASLDINEIYIEGTHINRSDWVASFRNNSVAVVPELFVLAKATGRTDARFADLLSAKDDVHDQGIYLLEASTGHRSNDRKQWSIMKARAREMLSNAVKSGKVGAHGFGYSDTELMVMRGIMESKHFKNFADRRSEMIARGLRPPGRSWCYTKLPLLTTKLGIITPYEPPKRKRGSLVYFIQDGEKVKIGHSIKPKKRMASLKTHTDLGLLATFPGGPKRELYLHKKFAKFKVPGTREWFYFVPQIKIYISKFVRKRDKA